MKFLFLLFALLVSGVAVQARQHTINLAIKLDLYGHLKTDLDAFEVDCGRYPTTLEGFQALLKCPTNIPAGKWHGPYLEKLPQDPWGHDYVYVCPGIHNTNGYDLYSCGFDGISKSGGDDLDDINNWNPRSPRNGTDFLLNHFEVFLFPHRFLVLTIFLIYQVISVLGGLWFVASLFSRRVSASISRHPMLNIIWFLVTLADIFILRTFIFNHPLVL